MKCIPFIYRCQSCEGGQLIPIIDGGIRSDYYQCDKCRDVYNLGKEFKRLDDEAMKWRNEAQRVEREETREGVLK